MNCQSTISPLHSFNAEKKNHTRFKFGNVKLVKLFILSKSLCPKAQNPLPWLLVGVKFLFQMIVKMNLKICT